MAVGTLSIAAASDASGERPAQLDPGAQLDEAAALVHPPPTVPATTPAGRPHLVDDVDLDNGGGDVLDDVHRSCIAPQHHRHRDAPADAARGDEHVHVVDEHVDELDDFDDFDHHDRTVGLAWAG